MSVKEVKASEYGTKYGENQIVEAIKSKEFGVEVEFSTDNVRTSVIITPQQAKKLSEELLLALEKIANI